MRVHMRIRSSALGVLCALACAAPGAAAKSPLGLYYSFDRPAPGPVLTAMQAELSRIFAPSGISADWRASGRSSGLNEDFPGVVVFRFSGHCTFDGFDNDAPDPAGEALAETDTIGAHVLPFAKVNCDRVRAFIAPALKAMPRDWKSGALGRALARVSAHEIYHMLAGVEEHGNRGIFQAGHSRADLTAPAFSFAAPENNWLHAWLERQKPPEQVVQTLPSQPASTSEEPAYDGSGDAAGR